MPTNAGSVASSRLVPFPLALCAGNGASIVDSSEQDRVSELLRLRKHLQDQQAEITRELRNERRKRRRLLGKAGDQCSLNDLLSLAATKMHK